MQSIPVTRALKTIALGLLLTTAQQTMAQDNTTYAQRKAPPAENYGNTLNLGVGFAYFGNIDGYVPIVFADYEFKVARNFTLAPFIGFSSYRSNGDYYYGNNGYYYTESIIPVGVKGAYYFDELLGANPKWDFYLAASLGFVFDNVTWQDGYNGNTGVAHTASPLYLAGHIGARYHFNRRVGIYADLSTGVSTVGLSFHGRGR